MSVDAEGINLRLSREPWADRYALYVVRYNLGAAVGQKTEMVVSAEWDVVPEGTLSPETPFRIAHSQAQNVMDELWRNGVRPTEVGSAAHVDTLASERDHLRSLLDRVLPSALRK